MAEELNFNLYSSIQPHFRGVVIYKIVKALCASYAALNV